MVLLAAAETIQGAFEVTDLILLYRRPMSVLRITLATILVNLGGRGAADRARWGSTAQPSPPWPPSPPVRSSAASCFVHALACASRFTTARGRSSPPPLPFLPPRRPCASSHRRRFLFVAGAALVAALLVYAALLKLWLTLAGKSLALVKFQTD